jgi:hypothetical protein
MSGKIKEKTSEDRIFGSYLFVNYANKGKLEKINQVFTEYKKPLRIYPIIYGVFSFTQANFLIERR